MTGIDSLTADDLRELVTAIVAIQSEAAKAGALLMWTIYDHPRDYPNDYVARCFDVAKVTLPTDRVLKSRDVKLLRSVFELAGLVPMTRNKGDDPVIMETWM